MLIFFVACGRDQKQKVVKKYGNYQTGKENREVLLTLSSFKQYEMLLNRIDNLTYSDSIPQISIKKENIQKVINLHNSSPESLERILHKQKNIIKIHNDSVYKFSVPYTLDSLKNIMQRNYLNKGKLDRYCSNPEKLLIQISYNDTFDNLEEVLHLVTESYDSIQPKVSLKICLIHYINLKLLFPTESE
ncbi:hypothetical protein IMCC3317_16710 [Kordia antarctica]|uniref:Uncharacterized protein n=2 Tax=Kordia antarctica TaxID=1218801 RepID=A0A7L4ZIQ9_9FLAO|nr:hypothetical protein IMCC3317_16710 [Kordia antarctica]